VNAPQRRRSPPHQVLPARAAGSQSSLTRSLSHLWPPSPPPTAPRATPRWACEALAATVLAIGGDPILRHAEAAIEALRQPRGRRRRLRRGGGGRRR
jgi:hypothetical protein